MYESDLTRFMREFLEKNPRELEEQRKGRALWWDKPQSLEILERDRAAKVPPKPYYYQPD